MNSGAQEKRGTEPPEVGEPVAAGGVACGGGDRSGDVGGWLGGDPELAWLDERMSPEARELLALCRALCRRRLLGIPDALYAPTAGNC